MHGLSFQARRQTDTLSHAETEKPRREQNTPPRRNGNLFRPGPKNTHENRNQRQTRGLESVTFAERLPERTEEEAEAAKKVHEPKHESQKQSKTKGRQQRLEVPEEMTALLQDDFVRSRQATPSITAEDFARWLTTTRLLAASHLEPAVRPEHYHAVKALEMQRLERRRAKDVAL